MLRTIAPLAVVLLIAAGAASAQPTGSIAGRYEGDFDGAEGSITIAGAGPKVHVVADVGGDHCGGRLEGQGAVDAKGRVIVLGAEPDINGEQCRLTMSPSRAGAFKVEEENCGYYHGASCAFAGEVVRKAAAKGGAPGRQSTPVNGEIIGSAARPWERGDA